jgi:hypothetical protein
MRTLLLSAFAFGVLSFASCKKDYTCTCTVTSGGSTTSGKTTIHESKKDAEEACNAGDASYSSAGVTITTSCELD